MRSELAAIYVTQDAAMHLNHSAFTEFMLEPQQVAEATRNQAADKEFLQAVDGEVDRMLGDRSGSALIPESNEWVSLAWCCAD